jgi:hypothetical protein
MVKGFAEAVPLEDASVDIVVLDLVQRSRALKDVRGVLRPTAVSAGSW